MLFFTGNIFFYWQNPQAIALMLFGVTFGLCHSSCKDKLTGLSGWSQMLLALMPHQFSLKMKSWANLGSQKTLADDLFMIKRQHNFLMSIYAFSGTSYGVLKSDVSYKWMTDHHLEKVSKLQKCFLKCSCKLE